MAADFNELIRKQRELQLAIGGSDPASFERTDTERMEYVREMVLACTDELHEFLGETGWKTWASSNHINIDAAFSELCDALQFWMNLVSLLGKTGDDVAKQLDAKRAINWSRVNNGYSGMQKCPACKRALDDFAVHCYDGYCSEYDMFLENTAEELKA